MTSKSVAVGRRAFLATGLTAMVGAARSASGFVRQSVPFRSSPFALGVASGDPTSDSVVLWTRLAPDPLNGGGMPDDNVAVGWELAHDERFAQVIRRGTETAVPLTGHSVHVEVNGLEPDRWYWYRFTAAGEESRVGRTRTLPAVGQGVDRLRLAFASCQHWEQGYFTAYRHMVEEDLDLVFHLGDYIYEYEGREDRVRQHIGEEIELLADYRNRHALYRTDPDLQTAHAMFPWIVTWDDHEVDNNYAADVSEEEGFAAELFLRRRAEAYQAYYEHMPLRPASQPVGASMQLYRRFTYGDLATFHVLDTRQYRTNQPCGDRPGPACPAVLDPDATLLGATQETWLREGFETSASRWNVVPQQVMMGRVDRAPGDDERIGMDIWSGYEVARRRMMSFFGSRPSSNPVVLTGDIHSNWVNDLRVDYTDPTAPAVATEFVGTSISSGGDGSDTSGTTDTILAENPSVRFFNGQRGYVSCEATPGQWKANYRVLDFVTRPNSPIATRASFLVLDGRPGAELA